MFECTRVEKYSKFYYASISIHSFMMKICYYNVELLTVIEFLMYNAAEIFFCCLLPLSKLLHLFEYLNHHLNMNLFKQQNKNVDHMLRRNRLLFIVKIVIQIQSNAFFLYEFLFSSNLWENT